MGPKRICKDAKQSLSGWVKSDFGSNFSDARRVDHSKKTLNSSVIKWCYPKTSSQLVIQKKKIEELKSWLEVALQQTKKASILLLRGPPGSGKTITLKLLTKELNAEICYWEEPLRALSAQEWDYRLWCNTGTGITSDKNPIQHLEEFLKRHNKYCKLPISSGNIHGPKLAKKIIVMKNFFSAIYSNMDFWHHLLVQHYNHGSVPLVLIWTEVNSDFNLLSQTFPNEVQLNIHLTTIHFNRIADTFVLKALHFATSDIHQFPKGSLQEIVDSCNGDLQFAFNTLKLVTKSFGKWDTVSQATSSGGMKRSREKSTISSRYASKDHSYEFMHLLGKVLYAKRVASDEPLSLTCHLQTENRYPLKDNPSDLADQISPHASKVPLYLHQNLGSTFSCIDDICKAAHYLSSADVLHSQSPEQHEKIEEFSLFVAILGTMHSHVASKPSSWLPLKKPEYYSLQEKRNQFKSALMDVRPVSLENEYSIEIFPYLKLISAEGKGYKEGTTNPKKRFATLVPACNAYAPQRCQANAFETTYLQEELSNTVEDDEIVIEEFSET